MPICIVVSRLSRLWSLTDGMHSTKSRINIRPRLVQLLPERWCKVGVKHSCDNSIATLQTASRCGVVRRTVRVGAIWTTSPPWGRTTKGLVGEEAELMCSHDVQV